MKNLVSKIWLPAALAAMTALHSTVPSNGIRQESVHAGIPVELISQKADTVIYPAGGYKAGWTEEDFRMASGALPDSLMAGDDTLGLFVTVAEAADTAPKLTARDTIQVPDSLRLTDPFRHRYYVALMDHDTYHLVRDSLIAAGDSLDWPRLDSLYLSDSLLRKQLEFDRWYAGLSRAERKKYDTEQKTKAKLEAMNLKQERKDSLKAIRDSIRENTPRILSTYAFSDSLQYKRMLVWTQEQAFHKLKVAPADTGFNYRFYDYPFLRKDVNATWLGVAGSPVLYYNWFNRKSTDKVSFYEALESWSYTPETVPFYNTKTPYTELGYFGTLFAGSEKESDNLHLLTSQNITPEFNFTLAYDRFGGGGILSNETTVNKNSRVILSYLGKKYLAHGGIISNSYNRTENGGIRDLSGIRDTTVDARELDVWLSSASSKARKATLFLDQQYRIPFTFINKIRYKGMEVPADSLDDNNITTAYIGHSTEYSSYRRWYEDAIGSSDTYGEEFYGGMHFINPSASSDSMRVSRFENKVFIKLQPWAEDAIVSKLNVGIGDRMLNWYSFDPSYTHRKNNVRWNSAYLYAGVEGNIRDNMHWDAKGEYTFLGEEINNMGIEGNLSLNFYPFRRARKSPVSIDLHFDTSLDEPDYYQKHTYTNHFKWDNDFSKISTTRIEGKISVPRWRLSASAGYALLANNVYYDTLGIIRQNPDPMSILSARLDKEFVLGPLHFDNRVLFQLSSNQDVVPLPSVALNLKYYIQFNISDGILLMQIGANGLYNTAWYSPAWNPALGVFHNQKEFKYNNGPYIDAFVNMQWKRATIFVKLENANQGWPMDKFDYFSADRYIMTQRKIKIGVYWPFYTQPSKNRGTSQQAAPGGMSSGGQSLSRSTGGLRMDTGR